jgi:hypothetical protein
VRDAIIAQVFVGDSAQGWTKERLLIDTGARRWRVMHNRFETELC